MNRGAFQPGQPRRRHDQGSSATRRQRMGTRPKFFNDFSRARARACTQGYDRSDRATICPESGVNRKCVTHIPNDVIDPSATFGNVRVQSVKCAT